MQDQVLIVIPHYNESDRLCRQDILALAERDNLQVLLVNDGSADNTLELLHDVAKQNPECVHVFSLDQNSGKGEAVRQGILHGIHRFHPDIVGYIDADFSTPVSEVIRVLEEFGQSPAKFAMASRVQLLGRNIERNYLRHILGRVFATLASWILKLRVYDTQCGCKLFYVTDTKPAFETPFSSRWIFDVELILRLMEKQNFAVTDFIEVPLLSWRDVNGSKLSKFFMIRSGFELLLLFLKDKRNT